MMKRMDEGELDKFLDQQSSKSSVIDSGSSFKSDPEDIKEKSESNTIGYLNNGKNNTIKIESDKSSSCHNNQIKKLQK